VCRSVRVRSGAMGVSDGVSTVKLLNASRNGAAVYELKDAWVAIDCPHCGGVQALKIGQGPNTVWLRCATCEKGYVKNGGEVAPAALPMRTPDKLPSEDRAVWHEVRTCLGSGAHMAAVMLCRKLLLHLAVENGLEPENTKGHAPGFAECVKHLQKAGVITQQMLEWVEPIKDVGNTANHKIATVTKEQAEQVASFTLQLLVLAYELRMTPAMPTTALPNTAGVSSADHAGGSGAGFFES
jgi:hypothetical protein